MSVPRHLLSLLLALAFALGSLPMAVAKASPLGAMQVTICVGDQTQVVTLDASGRPVAAGHTCPDCVPAMFPGAFAAPPMALRPATPGRSLILPPPPVPALPAVLPHPARAPPILSV